MRCYARPYEKSEDEEARWLAAMTKAASGALSIPVDRVFLKQRKKQKGLDQYERLSEKRATVDVTEGGLRFRVNVSDYLDTGLFLDHRKTRALVRAESSGKRVLNLFCYTASFSVYAAAGGAAEIDSIDLSNTYLGLGRRKISYSTASSLCAWRRRNLRPAVPPLDVSASSAPTRSDSSRERRKRGLKWDRIILDPPTFSNSKKMEGTLGRSAGPQSAHRFLPRCASARRPSLVFDQRARIFTLRRRIPQYWHRRYRETNLGRGFLGACLPRVLYFQHMDTESSIHRFRPHSCRGFSCRGFLRCKPRRRGMKLRARRKRSPTEHRPADPRNPGAELNSAAFSTLPPYSRDYLVSIAEAFASGDKAFIGSQGEINYSRRVRPLVTEGEYLALLYRLGPYAEERPYQSEQPPTLEAAKGAELTFTGWTDRGPCARGPRQAAERGR